MAKVPFSLSYIVGVPVINDPLARHLVAEMYRGEVPPILGIIRVGVGLFEIVFWLYSLRLPGTKVILPRSHRLVIRVVKIFSHE